MNHTNTIFLYWENKKGCKRAPYLDACLATIKKHNKNVVVVTPNNINDYIPIEKINTKIWLLDRVAQRSDYFRYLILNHNGGLWLDFDTICFSNLNKVFDSLTEYEIAFHSEQFFAARKGTLSAVTEEIEYKLNKKLTKTYLWKQKVKKIIYNAGVRNIRYKIDPFDWTELGINILKEKITKLKVYKIPLNTINAKVEYNWEPLNNRKILSQDIDIDDFINPDQLIIKLYNNTYNDEIKKKLNSDPSILFNKLISKSLNS